MCVPGAVCLRVSRPGTKRVFFQAWFVAPCHRAYLPGGGRCGGNGSKGRRCDTAPVIVINREVASRLFPVFGLARFPGGKLAFGLLAVHILFRQAAGFGRGGALESRRNYLSFVLLIYFFFDGSILGHTPS